jgi:tRNA pseudouridine38-40 synthase
VSAAGPRSGRYYRATVAYDGTDYCGFQIQVEQPTVQGVLEGALEAITQKPVRVIAAGRTDSGVHALGQVVAFRAGWQRSAHELHRAWNAVLPRDVSVCSLTEAEEGFHPRYDARSRVYQYTIWAHPVRNPLLRHMALWFPRPLDVSAMSEAALALLGEHDFATFGSPPQGENTVRRVVRAVWAQDEHKLSFQIEATAFLYRMVRSIVGTLLQVGTGELTIAEFGAALDAADRSRAGPTAQAKGLCLLAVIYGPTAVGHVQTTGSGA